MYKRKTDFFSQIQWFCDDNTILISLITCIICSSWSFRHTRILFSQFTMSLTFYFKYLPYCPYSLQEANWYIKKNRNSRFSELFQWEKKENDDAKQLDYGWWWRRRRPHWHPAKSFISLIFSSILFLFLCYSRSSRDILAHLLLLLLW